MITQLDGRILLKDDEFGIDCLDTGYQQFA